MRKVIGIGETVYDIVFKDGRPTAAVPGGSTFNSMISLGRCGIPSDFLSEVGNDKVGSIILDFMSENGVDPSFVNILPAKTPLSLAFLDADNDASYTFYRDRVEDRPALRYPEIFPDDIVLFGSFYALNPAVRPRVKAFLEYARSRDAILYYDVNFRPSHLKDLGDIGDAVQENFTFADIVRGSHEDFLTLFGMEDVETVFLEKISAYCGNFIRTFGASPLKVLDHNGFRCEYPVSPVETVSTIGAGDSFNAGFIYGLIKNGVSREVLGAGLPAGIWDDLVASAQSFSASCCQSSFNYITPDLAASLKT